MIGSKQFNKNYISSLISQWCEIITELSLIAKTHSAFTSGYKQKFTFFIRTIENIENVLLPLDKVIRQKLITTLFNDFPTEELRSLIVLPCKLGGMSIVNPIEIANERIRKIERINQEINKPYYTTTTQLHSLGR